MLLPKLFAGDLRPELGKRLSDDIPNLFVAASENDVSSLDEALGHWDVNTRDENGMTALHYAAGKLSFEAVDRLLEELDNGLDPTVEDNFGRDAAWLVIDVYGHENAVAKQMYDRLSPYVYPETEEDMQLQNDGADEPSGP